MRTKCMKLYHETRAGNLPGIRSKGLRAHYLPRWYTLTDWVGGAYEYTSGDPDRVIIEVCIPAGKVAEYLWPIPGYSEHFGNQYALRKALPPEYIKSWKRAGDMAPSTFPGLPSPAPEIMRNPVPTTALPPGPYWHGTSYSAGRSILSEGELRRKPSGKPKKGLWASIAERVYVTTNPYYAAIYAAGGDMFGSTIPTRGMANDPEKRYGFLFQVEMGPGSDAIIDEDQLGQFAVEGKIPWLTEMAQRLVTREVWKRAKDGEYKDWIRVGKALHKKMLPKEEQAVVSVSTQFAIKGTVRPVRAWLVDRLRIGDMKKDDFDSIIALSEEVPVERAAAVNPSPLINLDRKQHEKYVAARLCL